MELGEIIRSLPQYQCEKTLDGIHISNVEKDHRQVTSNTLFICIHGYTVDGHQFAAEAVTRGAVAIVAEKPLSLDVPVIIVPNTKRVLPQVASFFYDYPTTKMKMIGVTGTNGKTSVTHILEEILQAATFRTGLIGTIGMRIQQKYEPVNNTTPDALVLQKSFDQMVQKQIDVGIMEVSSHALDQGRVHGTDFDLAVFTNLTQDHLDYHQTMKDYLFAKSLLFSQLGNSYSKSKPKYAIINIDDPAAHQLIKSTAQPVITYGIEQEATFRANNITLFEQGVHFDMETPEGTISMNSHLIGKFSVYNMLAAAATAYYAGISITTIKEVIEQTKGVKGRFQPVLTEHDFGVIVDYAHTPDSLENVLQTIKNVCHGNVYAIVGCGGDRDRNKRPQMADITCRYADKAIFTSDNPRSEDPLAIIDDMVVDLDATNYQVIADRKQAIRTAIQQATSKDMVLIAGKGHETYQVIGDHTYEFDDEKVALQVLQEEKK
ncbi:UDP-N-acetylmuramoylalanyl-D-glutamate--2,6- diaminopimelate ligase [Gracilibacillus halophilus YIM-C55.5]|uniref:UDP-N-acetylmuramoyl-L-alanyl-D-glutamate--2,6-diaminopimelate ligase n=1 Tax=Gracilibacillus halophilus YIM-C55.5 TaxID=1308866 RepID=N4WQC0_9BACI|nr:UDP-N-acetylmuramoyl-L-alanyl-D-glutamate--2,6-diaminopimelate ligase [Gracilibacillus halophilus]ENH98332.1 UDP-N-acetylmuramoylalanyl-D-glutamate--2,6- diaminopimelate ligase [Gracilibacillus halophilus YIM-C55.5]